MGSGRDGGREKVHVARAHTHTGNCNEGADSSRALPLLITSLVAAFAAGVADMLCSALPGETLGGPEVGACQACCCFRFLCFRTSRRATTRGLPRGDGNCTYLQREGGNKHAKRCATVVVFRTVVDVVVHQYVAASPVYSSRGCRGQSSSGVFLVCLCLCVVCDLWTRREARVEELAADTRAPSPRRSELMR